MLTSSFLCETPEQTFQLGEEIGKKAKELGIDFLLAVNPNSKATVTSFGANGFHFATKQELIQALKELLDKNTVVLVKGSRGSRMEDIVNAIRDGNSTMAGVNR